MPRLDLRIQTRPVNVVLSCDGDLHDFGVLLFVTNQLVTTIRTGSDTKTCSPQIIYCIADICNARPGRDAYFGTSKLPTHLPDDMIVLIDYRIKHFSPSSYMGKMRIIKK